MIPVTVVSGLSREANASVVKGARARSGGKNILEAHDFDEAVALAAQGAADAIFIVNSPTEPPLEFVESFAHSEGGEHEGEHAHGASAKGKDHGPRSKAVGEARLDTLVTVVDAATFLKDFFASDGLAERGLANDAHDERTVSDVLVEQVEMADVLVVNADGKPAAGDPARLLGLLSALNPRARIVRAEQGAVDAKEVLASGLFDFDRTLHAASWMQALAGEVAGSDRATSKEHGLTRFVFRARRPLHPGRFWNFVNEEGHGILRSKGFLWLATRPDFVSLWSQAGNSCQLDPEGSWWANTPASEWPESESARADILSDWDEKWGDKRQELVLVGLGLDEAKLVAGIEACLLSDEELAAPEADWVLSEDPFPTWEAHLGEEEEEDEHHHHDHHDHSGCTHPSHQHPAHASFHESHGHDEHAHDHHDHDHSHDHHDHDHSHDHHDHAHSHEHHDHVGSLREEIDEQEREQLSRLSLGELEAHVDEESAHGHFGAAVAAQEALVALVPREDWAALAMARFKLALIYGEIGETHRSLPLYREAIRALEANADAETWMLSEIIHSYGKALVATRETARAREVFERGFAVAEKAVQPAWESQFALELGALLLARDSHDHAHDHAPGHGGGSPSVSAAHSHPHAEQAVTLFRRAVSLREPLGDRAALASATLRLGLALEATHDVPAARETLERTLVLLGSDEDSESEKASASEALARLKAQGLRSRLRLEF